MSPEESTEQTIARIKAANEVLIKDTRTAEQIAADIKAKLKSPETPQTEIDRQVAEAIAERARQHSA